MESLIDGLKHLTDEAISQKQILFSHVADTHQDCYFYNSGDLMEILGRETLTDDPFRAQEPWLSKIQERRGSCRLSVCVQSGPKTIALGIF